MKIRQGDVVSFRDHYIKIDRIFGYTITQVQIFGHFVDAKGKKLPGSARKGSAAGWFTIRDLVKI